MKLRIEIDRNANGRIHATVKAGRPTVSFPVPDGVFIDVCGALRPHVRPDDIDKAASTALVMASGFVPPEGPDALPEPLPPAEAATLATPMETLLDNVPDPETAGDDAGDADTPADT
jgi:hypothetical protein